MRVLSEEYPSKNGTRVRKRKRQLKRWIKGMQRIAHKLLRLAFAVILVGSGCSIRRMAVNKVGDALAGSGTTFAADDDPELIKAAAPFSLKLMESLLEESPR